MDINSELPEDIVFDPNDPTALDDLPELPEGMVWAVRITAEADVIHADGTVN